MPDNSKKNIQLISINWPTVITKEVDWPIKILLTPISKFAPLLLSECRELHSGWRKRRFGWF